MAKRKQAADPVAAGAGAQTPDIADAPAAHFVMFRINDERFGFPLGDVAEILRLPSMVKMPLGPKSLIGLSNLRGEVLPVIGLRRLIGLPDIATSEATRIVVIDRGASVGFLVDRIDGLMAVPADRLSKQAAGAVDPDLLQGAIKGGEGDDGIRIFDPVRLLQGEFARLGAAAPRRASRIAVANGVTDGSRAEQRHRMALLSFELAGQEYAVPLQAVQEIVLLPHHVAELPRPETAVLGVVTLRDRLLPLVSLRTLLGMPEAWASGPRRKVVVLALGSGVIGVVADATRDILRVDPAVIEPAPALLTRGDGEAEISSICRLENGRRLVAVLEPEQLFRSDLMQRLLAQQGGDASTKTERARMADQQFIIFRLGEQEYGLPIAAVDEVARPPERMTKLPKAPAFVDGMINLRGSVVPIVDLRRRFELPGVEQTGSQRILVLAIAGGKTGFMVDNVSEVLKVEADAISVAPELAEQPLIDRVVTLDHEGRMILLIDPAQLLDRVEADLLAKFVRTPDQALKAS